ncbi:MAG: FAD-dependent oxidoreductase [Alphaproteobacteria bacterium]
MLGADIRDHQVIVVGAGLAGAMLAHTLAQQGISVAVCEQSPHPFTGGASHHHACALYPLIHAAPCAEDVFFLQAYEYALKKFADQPFFHPAPLRLPTGKRHSPLWQNHLEVTDRGTYLLTGGWVDPRMACQQYLQDIPVFYGVSFRDWRDCPASVVLCAGSGMRDFFPHWPWRLTAGQTDYGHRAEGAAPDTTILCDDGFMIPMTKTAVACGGTYRPHQDKAPVLAQDTQKNLSKIPLGVPHPDLKPTTGVRIRGRTILPCVGYGDAGGAFVSVLTKDTPTPTTPPNPWILTGFGSRGMVTIPWSVHCLGVVMMGSKKDLAPKKDLQSPV